MGFLNVSGDGWRSLWMRKLGGQHKKTLGAVDKGWGHSIWMRVLNGPMLEDHIHWGCGGGLGASVIDN